MWLLFLLTGAWLSGTLFVPVLILLRWMGARFKRLHWLVRSRKAWVLIWGYYGAIKVIVLSAVFFLLYREYYGVSMILGWSGQAAERLLGALHIHVVFFQIGGVLVVLLSALLEGIVCCGLATLAWWCFEWVTRSTGLSRRATEIERYVVSLLICAWLLGVANRVAFDRASCSDCAAPLGVPFSFYHDSGFALGPGFLWRGVVGELLLVVAIGLVAGLVWNLISRWRVARQTATP
jgi:hypothetical protein